MLEITVLNDSQHFQELLDVASFRFGSCNESGENQISIDDPQVSKFQGLVELLEEGKEPRIKITNLGGSMVVGNNSRIHHLVSRTHELPCCLGAGDSYIQVTQPNQAFEFDKTIQKLEVIGSSAEPSVLKLLDKESAAPSKETLSSWFEALGQIQRSTAGHGAYFKLASRVVFNPGGLDGCIILMRQLGSWEIVAQHIPFPTDGFSYRRDLVNLVAESRVPIFHDSSLIDENFQAVDPHAAVVCPIFDENKDVVGMVYGFRNNLSSNKRRGIRPLEAKFVNLITDSVSAGIIRLNREAERARNRVLLEQVFSPSVARHLEANPDMLNKGRETEVSVLFADLRGFCRISEEVGASVTYQLLSDVMNRFAKIVHDNQGVIIDFYGDGMSAFWNAPVPQKDHALLACKAGLAIINEMRELNESWSVTLGQRLRVGIGVNTGVAQVGNSGSLNRLKYGPQGSCVNIASRLEQSTKKLGVNIVVSESTAKQVSDNLVARRICNVRLDGITNTVSAFALIEPVNYAKQSKFFEAYQRGLELFEDRKFLEALQLFSDLAGSDLIRENKMLEFMLGEIREQVSKESDDPIGSGTTLADRDIAISL